VIQDEFLRDIIEHRDDDAPRLIYADWLEEQGERDRAEFIRAQCELAHLAGDAPRRPGLKRRSEELLGQHAGEWLRPLPEWAVREPPQWRRGFVAAVRAKGEDFLRGAEELLRLCPLEGAFLTEAREHLPELLQRTHLANLTSLDLNMNEIEDEGAVALASSPHLANLTTLGLYGNRIGAEGAKALAGSPHLANLATLDLRGNDIGDEGAEALAGSRHLANLATLDLRGNGIGDEGAVALAESPYLDGLVTLDLSFNGIGAEGAVALASSPHLAKLATLLLNHNGIEDEGAKALAGSPRLAKLTSLELHDNEIGDEGTEALRQRFGAGVRC
jgi:uncharacterized protein (TIGR02996 family)